MKAYSAVAIVNGGGAWIGSACMVVAEDEMTARKIACAELHESRVNVRDQTDRFLGWGTGLAAILRRGVPSRVRYDRGLKRWNQ